MSKPIFRTFTFTPRTRLISHFLPALIVLFAGLTLLQAEDVKTRSARDFYSSDLNGRKVHFFSELEKSELTLVNFWATWCIPCKAEIPHIKDLNERYGDKGLRVISVSVDDPRTAGRVRAYVRSNKMDQEIWMDTNNSAMKGLNIPSVPHTFLVTKDRQLLYEKNGFRQGDEKVLEGIILDYLAADDKDK